MLPRLLPDQCLIFTFSFGMEIYVVNDTQNSEINKGLLHEIIFSRLRHKFVIRPFATSDV